MVERGREDSVKGLFHRGLYNYALKNDHLFIDMHWSGQDREVNADNMFVTGVSFSLVEFKSRESDIESEHKKPRSNNLCARLPIEKNMQNYHQKCHFIAWGEDDFDEKLRVKFDVYQKKVCKRSNGSMGNAETFAYCAFNNIVLGMVGLNKQNFKEYLRWLYTTRDSSDISSGDIDLQLYAITNNDEIQGMAFKSMNSFFEFISKYVDFEPPKNDYEPPVPRPW